MSVEANIRNKLTAAFAPTQLEVINESYKHNVPSASESHFKVLVVSEAFAGKTPLQKHRLVNAALAEELQSSVHALSIQTSTPDQWTDESTVSKTPSCMGGSHK